MAVFGGDHFIAAKFIAPTIPSWIPWHRFWTYSVGTALIAAALSLVTKQHSLLAATLLSAMLFSFVLLIHTPNLAANRHDRILFAIVLRDTSFSAGAMACALAQADAWPKRLASGLTIVVRWAIAIPTVVFGVEHFLFPQSVPVIPLKQLMPPWIPGHMALSYATGAVMIACGLCLLFNWRAHQAATWLGIVVFAVVMLVYFPIMAAKMSDIGNGLNYFADTLVFSGVALLLARVLPSGELAKVTVPSRTESAVRVGVSG